ncbi:MAG: zinc-dependent alcohol dehydrogenase family protein [Defluviitoga tunisiensis]|mgnify:CR=1 FL=1|jgi:alcohol dehydrogenase|nr:zinc-dependent alcohol dehydrogenase family protein [Defluviitoga tunisiensis]
MKALVYHGPNNAVFEDKPKPKIVESTDAIVKITKTTICGTDLHILKGDVPSVTDGRILGHEAVGIVEEVGEGVFNFKKGDHVIISCVTACGRCENCKKQMYSHCENGGWILGNTIDGTQAEFVRIPYADTSLYHIPANIKEEALVMLSDILPTGFEIGVLKGTVSPGETIAIVGAGPIGIAVLLTAQFYSPSEIIMIDLDENRLELSKQFGATKTINSSIGNEKTIQKVKDLTNAKGVDVAIEAVGIPTTFDLCQFIVKAGGHIANIGVHGKPVNFHIESLWDHNITLTTGLVDTYTIPLLLKTVQSGKLNPERLITHYFKLSEIMKAYETFRNAAKEKALKIVIENDL